MLHAFLYKPSYPCRPVVHCLHRACTTSPRHVGFIIGGFFFSLVSYKEGLGVISKQVFSLGSSVGGKMLIDWFYLTLYNLIITLVLREHFSRHYPGRAACRHGSQAHQTQQFIFLYHAILEEIHHMFLEDTVLLLYEHSPSLQR